MLKRFVRYMFVGYFTKENIPNPRVRRAALMATYSSSFYALQTMYYRDKLRVMAQHDRSEMSFRDYLRYEGYEGTADLLDRIDQKLADHVINSYPQSVPDFGYYGTPENERLLIAEEEHEDFPF